MRNAHLIEDNLPTLTHTSTHTQLQPRCHDALPPNAYFLGGDSSE